MFTYNLVWAVAEATRLPRRGAGPVSEPELSVVVASVNGMPYLGACLDALERNAPAAEVIVADWTDEKTRQVVEERFPDVRLLSFDEPMAVPELRAAGIFAARAPYVAVIEDHCNVTPGWADRIVAAHRAGHAVVGGPVRNVMTVARATGRRSFASTARS